MSSTTTPTLTKKVSSFDRSLRPKKLTNFHGQTQLKKNLKIFITAAQKRKESLEHLLFYGPPGLGKTTLAHIIATEIGVNIRPTSGPAITRAGDLASILTNLETGDILFIDEIHRLSKPVEEMLYPALEDFALDIIIGQGPSARDVRLELNRFTIIGATTRISLLSSPMRGRFGAIHRLQFYSQEELVKIINRSAKLLKFQVSPLASKSIAQRSRGTPRIANRLLKRVRDFVQVNNQTKITPKLVNQALDLLEIDSLGLTSQDRLLLENIVEHHQGGPVGINTLSAIITEDPQTIQEIYEPFLLQLGFLKRTSRGRVVTPRAYSHLGYNTPKQLKL